VIIRDYNKNDAAVVGLLIKNTYSEYNLDFLKPGELPAYLGPFAYAGDGIPAHQQAIHMMIQSKFVYLAEVDGIIVGVLRGRLDRLGSLFVDRKYHRQGIGRSLVEHFENEVRRNQGTVIRVASSLYAVPFYLDMGYQKSTGIRNSWSFQGYGLPIQPMKKIL
jgi:GNAT superfamily N-acetyltransferase